MQTSNINLPRDEPTKTLHDYLRNNYYKNLIALSLILMFSIVFHLIYLLVDSVSDKSKHARLSVAAYERYEAHKRRRIIAAETKMPTLNETSDNYELDKQKLAERKRNIEFNVWSYRNLQVSFIHSVLCSLWLVRIICLRNTEMMTDLLSFVSWDTYLLVAFSCGYFLYDLYDVYANGYAKREWVICVHHGIVLLTFTYHMMRLLNVAYTTLALAMEFNSVFLHARKLLKFYEFRADSLLVRINCACNMASFVVFRFGVLVCILLGMIYDGHRVSTNYLVMLGTCSFAMAIINVVLFKRLLVKDWLLCWPAKKQPTSYSTKLDDQSAAEALLTSSVDSLDDNTKCDQEPAVVCTRENMVIHKKEE